MSGKEQLTRDGADVTWRSSLFLVCALQLEKLSHRQSTAVYNGQSVMMMTLSEDQYEPRNPRTGELVSEV